MKRENWYLSTIDASAALRAREFGLGLEIAEFCTASNMDEGRDVYLPRVQQELTGISRCLLHGPFNELYPCAIDPRARELAVLRYRQALKLAESFGAEKLILHGGFQPYQYYPCWYVEQSILFWKAFLADCPDSCRIVLENVLETDPQWLLDIAAGVDDPRLRLCLDVGHANVYTKLPVRSWIETLSPYLSHFHIHNNEGTADTHSSMSAGSMDMRELLAAAEELCPDATFTLEVIDGTADSPFFWTLS